MSMSKKAIFPGNGKIATATVATANTALDGTGTVTTVVTADATNGTRVTTLKAMAIGTNVATVLRAFVFDGSVWRLFRELTIAANALSQTAQSVDTNIIDFGAEGLILGPTQKLGVTVGTTISAGLALVAQVGDYTEQA